MLNGIVRKLVAFIAAPVLLLLVSSVALAEYYPNSGSLYYDGFYYASSDIVWSDGWPWYSEYNGYEHDFAIRPNYLSSCTSWTTLPNGYDDCPTASAEGGGFWAFAFGSYYGRDIVANQWYFGVWNFSNDGPDPSTPFFLSGQEVWHQFCPWDSPWCMNGIQSAGLLSGQLNWGQSYWNSW